MSKQYLRTRPQEQTERYYIRSLQRYRRLVIP